MSVLGSMILAKQFFFFRSLHQSFLINMQVIQCNLISQLTHIPATFSLITVITIDQPDSYLTCKPFMIFDLETTGFGKYGV